MSYSVVKNDKNTFDVIEKDTDTKIELSMSKRESHNVCRKLNLGSGFAGYTPAFITMRTNIKKTK